MTESVTILFKVGNEEQKFVLDSRKSWKGKLIRGYDVAEIIAYEMWSKADKFPTVLEIISPAAYKGTYEIKVKWEPTFSAKAVDIVA